MLRDVNNYYFCSEQGNVCLSSGNDSTLYSNERTLIDLRLCSYCAVYMTVAVS
jgi:hypothetical protein